MYTYVTHCIAHDTLGDIFLNYAGTSAMQYLYRWSGFRVPNIRIRKMSELKINSTFKFIANIHVAKNLNCVKQS